MSILEVGGEGKNRWGLELERSRFFTPFLAQTINLDFITCEIDNNWKLRYAEDTGSLYYIEHFKVFFKVFTLLESIINFISSFLS